jgi:hypothetical protein
MADETHPAYVAISESWDVEWQYARYSPGVMLARPTVTNSQPCPADSTWAGNLLLRLNFVKADGTEIEFRGRGRSVITNACRDGNQGLCAIGEPVYATGRCSGTEIAAVDWDNQFVAVDGSAATFAADGVLRQTRDTTIPFGVTGTLYLGSGTRYRIEAGLVKNITDRNGNRIDYSYNGRSLTQIRDALDRVITFSYGNYSDDCTIGKADACDQVEYVGAGGSRYVIEIGYSSLGERLRPTLGQGTKTIGDLFPELRNAMNRNWPPEPLLKNWREVFNPARMVAWIQLPVGDQEGNANLRYDIYYNPWGEVAAVRLPTADNRNNTEYTTGLITIDDVTYVNIGGRIEYDWIDYGSTYVGTRMAAKRRVSMRASYTGPHPASRLYLKVPQEVSDPSGAAGTTVELRRCMVTGTKLGGATELGSVERHFYHGRINDAFNVGPVDYPEGLQGREWKTEVHDGVSGSECSESGVPGSLLKTTTYTWEQRLARSDERRYTTTVANVPGWDVRMKTQSTSLGARTSVVAYDYDGYNNPTKEEIRNYDGALLRRTARTFDDRYLSIAAGHLRTLVREEHVFGPSTDGTSGEHEEAWTRYSYDEGLPTPCPGVIQHTSLVNRGNLTTVEAHSDYPNDPVTTVFTKMTYDEVGNVTARTVAAGTSRAATTTYDYTDRFADPVPAPGTCAVPAVNRSTYAFPTKVTDPAGQVTEFTYDRWWGRAIRFKRPTGRIDEVNSRF